MSSIDNIPRMKASVLSIMASRAQDQELVADVGNNMALKTISELAVPRDLQRKVVPSFGWHPWFSHQLFDDGPRGDSTTSKILDKEEKIAHYQAVLAPKSEDAEFLSKLPDPVSLSHFLDETKARLEQFPLAMVGEVGLDRAFRLPESWLPEAKADRDQSLTLGGREGRQLSPYRVQIDHQRQILTAQLKLAGQMQRAMSVHGVQAHGILYETIKQTWKGYERAVVSRREQKRNPPGSSSQTEQAETKAGPFPPRLCLHSYSGPLDTLKLYLHPSVPIDIYASFSMVINFSTSAASKTEQVIKQMPDDRILVESDMHIAGERMDENLEAMARKICQLKGWSLSDGVKQLAENWKDFTFGKTRL